MVDAVRTGFYGLERLRSESIYILHRHVIAALPFAAIMRFASPYLPIVIEHRTYTLF